jgi:hypothetical protein
MSSNEFGLQQRKWKQMYNTISLISCPKNENGLWRLNLNNGLMVAVKFTHFQIYKKTVKFHNKYIIVAEQVRNRQYTKGSNYRAIIIFQCPRLIVMKMVPMKRRESKVRCDPKNVELKNILCPCVDNVS